jgi:2-oxoglutarate dehydrogenase E2 component (dihydrolipoamide succinyltransferase)
MPTEVVMPQMGESIAEGTIVRWIKKVGETVERDEPLFEISTDKVDAEIPSPAAGVVSEIRAKEGETVPVNSVVAVIGAAGAPAAAAPPQPVPQPAPGAQPAPMPSGAAPEQPGVTSAEEAIRQRSSPLVRRIAKEHHVDLAQIRGSGIAGRVTKDDILRFIEQGAPADARPPARTAPAAPRPVPQPGSVPQPATGTGLAGQTVPMSAMRRRIAEHMIASRRTSAHVHSVFEVNFSRVERAREAHKAEYERAGAKLTYLAFIMKAAVDALRAVPVVNASVEGESIVYHRHINIGVAVALDWGLIVPVVRNADEKNLLGLSRAVADLAGRARNKQLKPDEVTGGTFTITNPGVFGALFGMPIINQPQVAILGVGHVEKRPVVIEDAIAIRPMAYLSLGYDHRVIDGAVADEFLAHVKRTLESWDPDQA